MVAKKAAKKKPATKKKKEPEKVYTVEFTQSELEHVRDLFSILLPSDEELTISSALAEMKEQSEMEVALWEKLATLFESAGLSLGDDAPDFVIATTTGLYQLTDEGEDEQ